MRTVLFVGCLCLAVSMAFVLTGCGSGEGEEEAITQKTCPVMADPIDKDIYEDYKGKRVYFCCSGCKMAFEADPKKFMKKMADEGVILEDTPK